VHEEVIQLGCPTCGGPFQVTLAMSGQQIACPHCHAVVLLPELVPKAPQPTGLAWQETTLAPPAAEHRPQAPLDQPFEPAPAAPQRLESLTARSSPPETENVDDLLPPGVRDRRRPETTAPLPGPGLPTNADEALPPAAKPKKRKSTGRNRPTEATKEDELLPPPARPSREARKKAERSEVDDLLPPAAEKKGGQEQPAAAPQGEQPVRKHRRPGEAADGSVLIPTEEGKYIALREAVKTVSVGGREVELRRLTPEEKASRRFRRNLFVAGFGLIFLIVFLLVAAYVRGL
jgi:DNA-directed RNA polymerase subunit RPC12/RpoP